MFFQYIITFLFTFIFFLTLSNFLIPKNIYNNYFTIKNETYYIINYEKEINMTNQNFRFILLKIIDLQNKIK